MLHHHPPAHRRAARPRTLRSIRHSRRVEPRLFLGLGDLPRSRSTYCEQLPTGEWVLLARYNSEYGQIAHDYAYNTSIPAWMGARMYQVYGSISPAVDPDGYLATHWWHDEWLADEAALLSVGQLASDLARPRRASALVDILDPYAAGPLKDGM